MRNERLLPIFAIILLLIGCISTLYVYANTIEIETITINDQTFTYPQIFANTQKRTIDTFEGIALDTFIITAGVDDPTTHDYTIIGSDGYQKTVQWNQLTTGLLTADGEVIFQDLPKAFRVKDVVEIKVI